METSRRRRSSIGIARTRLRISLRRLLLAALIDESDGGESTVVMEDECTVQLGRCESGLTDVPIDRTVWE